MREQMEQHRADPVCAVCHKTTDAIGFALENFNEIGGWRNASEGGMPLNTAVTLADGTKVDGARDLRMALTKNPETFVETFTEKMLIYALGRGVTWQDMPAIRHILNEAQPQDYRFSALILGIVKSVPFEMRMKAANQKREKMFLTKKSLPRRTFLRGVGAAVALPMLDAMTPAASAASRCLPVSASLCPSRRRPEFVDSGEVGHGF